MSLSSAEATEALEALRRSRAELAAAANCPPARHLAFAGLLGGLIAGQAAPLPWPLFVEALMLAGVALVVIWDRRRTGMFINGYRAGRTRPLTFTLLGLTLGLLALALWLRDALGIVWAPIGCGAVASVLAYFASAWWQRIYRRELEQLP
ncbi:hypothetical protein ACO2Q3_06805 [Caulobacter sp. KR2-114]|uniref:hypothetical protein n=1 Tax=Caulobacter sp. KR2-114 TaxID=3400912 RepID=UPI003C076645